MSLSEAGHVPPGDSTDQGAGGYERQVSAFAGQGNMLSPASTAAPMTARSSIAGGADFRRWVVLAAHGQQVQQQQHWIVHEASLPCTPQLACRRHLLCCQPDMCAPVYE